VESNVFVLFLQENEGIKKLVTSLKVAAQLEEMK